MVAAAVDEGVAILEFTDRRMLPTELDQVCRRLHATPTPGRHRHIERLRAQLDEYFAGTRPAFDVPLVLTGTPFEEASWTYLRTIPAGETRSYAEGAQALGRPTSFRAFARANGANRIAIVIPCHRVIGSDGSLTGYGGGLDRKQALLDLEAQSGSSRRVRSPRRSPPRRNRSDAGCQTPTDSRTRTTVIQTGLPLAVDQTGLSGARVWTPRRPRTCSSSYGKTTSSMRRRAASEVGHHLLATDHEDLVDPRPTHRSPAGCRSPTLRPGVAVFGHGGDAADHHVGGGDHLADLLGPGWARCSADDPVGARHRTGRTPGELGIQPDVVERLRLCREWTSLPSGISVRTAWRASAAVSTTSASMFRARQRGRNLLDAGRRPRRYAVIPASKTATTATTRPMSAAAKPI